MRSARQCDRSDAQALFVPCEREDERLARRVGSPVLQAMARLMCDVDMTEQAELWRLECGEPSPRARATCVAPAWAPCSPSEADAGARRQARKAKNNKTTRHAAEYEYWHPPFTSEHGTEGARLDLQN